MSTDIVIVNPSNKKQMYGKLGESLAGIEPPLWGGLLAGYLRAQGFLVRIIDADAEDFGTEGTVEKIIEYNPLLLAVGAVGANPSASSTPKMMAVQELLEAVKKRRPELKNIVYGIHPSALPDVTLEEQSIDFVCRGEAFYPVEHLLKTVKTENSASDYNFKGICYRKDGKTINNGWADVVQDLDKLPMAAWDLLPMDRYRAHNWHCFGHMNERSPYAIVYTSLGCPFNCRYCNIHALYSGKPGIRYRSPEKIIEEIGLLVKNYKVKNFKFLDELFVIKGERLDKICDLLIERNYDLNIWAYARVDTVDEYILKKLKKAGVRWLCYGIEAGNKEVRQGVAKGRFDRDLVMKAMKMTQDAGIHIIGNFMFGLPDDTLETMQETLSLAQEINCEYVNFYVTMAYPGSDLYDDAVKDDIPLPASWIGYSQFSKEIIPLPTKYLTAAQVLRFRDEAFNKYYSNPKYLKMIGEKFGKETVEHIHRMLEHKLERNILKDKSGVSA